ncbi:MAG: RDD family protein [Methylophagaceae bacterium]
MTEHSNTVRRPSLFRMLAVMFYDAMVLLSILFLASLIAVIINDGKAISQGNLFFIAYLFAVSWLFYVWFWTHGGQTIGMRAWKVYLLSEEQNTISWRQSTLRFVAAFLSWIPLGVGFWWQYLGDNNKSWADKLSATYLHYDKDSR